MSITEKDYRNSIKQHPNVHPMHAKRPINERLLQQAVVDSELLVGHPGWDKYLTHIQAVLDEARGDLKHKQSMIGGAYKDEDLRLIQCEIRELSGRISALEYCMTLPKQFTTEAQDHGLLTGFHE